MICQALDVGLRCQSNQFDDETLCMLHFGLWRYWVEVADGHRVWRADADREWKRSRFRFWLESMSLEDRIRILVWSGDN